MVLERPRDTQGVGFVSHHNPLVIAKHKGIKIKKKPPRTKCVSCAEHPLKWRARITWILLALNFILIGCACILLVVFNRRLPIFNGKLTFERDTSKVYDYNGEEAARVNDALETFKDVEGLNDLDEIMSNVTRLQEETKEYKKLLKEMVDGLADQAQRHSMDL